MFFGILSTILASFSTVFRKKALSFNLSFSVSPRLFALLAFFGPISLIIYFFIFGKYDFSGLNYKILGLILLISFINLIRVQIGQYVYKNEKISILTPYENLNKIFSIVLAFFIFNDVSLVSFLLTLSAGIIIIISSIDFKTFKVPKLIKLFSLVQVMKSIIILLVGFLLKQITDIDYYILSISVYMFFLFLIVVYKKELGQVKKLPKRFYLTRFSSSTFGSISEIINLSIIASLGVSISILFSYFYIGFILILSYVFFKDKPSLKNIILTILLAILVGLGYYYK